MKSLKLNICNKIGALALFTLMAFSAMAQDNGDNSSVAAADGESAFDPTLRVDLVSQYIWRGQDMGHFSIQPTLGIGWKGLSLTAWGSAGITDPSDNFEIDLTLAYTYKGFNVGITDYWVNDPNPKYFQYAAHSTSHVWEANVGYDFNFLSVQWYTNIGGNDGVDPAGHRAYSSYVEVAAPFNFAHLQWNAALGVVPYATSYYSTAHRFAVTNVSLGASYDIKVCKALTIPVYATLTANPSTQKFYFMAGVALQVF